MRGLTRLYRE